MSEFIIAHVNNQLNINFVIRQVILIKLELLYFQIKSWTFIPLERIWVGRPSTLTVNLKTIEDFLGDRSSQKLRFRDRSLYQIAPSKVFGPSSLTTVHLDQKAWLEQNLATNGNPRIFGKNRHTSLVWLKLSFRHHHKTYYECIPLYVMVLSLYLSQQKAVYRQTNLINVQNNVTYVNLFYCVMSIRYRLYKHRRYQRN